MPRRWSLGVDRIRYEGIDGDYDRLKKTAKAHSLHDTGKLKLSGGSGQPSNDLSGPSSDNAGTPQKRRWGR
ncbi:hypothetical protein [Streptomyces sp. NBC_01614]|uniref:hypothetical protein n=1 Tax=Streptomyces sp. NBC_01614 TaxID=2975897 RepID=UPI003868F229